MAMQIDRFATFVWFVFICGQAVTALFSGKGCGDDIPDGNKVNGQRVTAMAKLMGGLKM